MKIQNIKNDLLEKGGVDDEGTTVSSRSEAIRRVKAAAAGLESLSTAVNVPNFVKKDPPFGATVQATTINVQAKSTNSVLGPEWIRQEFPSRRLGAVDKDVYIRPLVISTMSKLFSAAQSKNITQMIDALAPHISVDIRSLTPPDYTFFLYWLRMVSFPKRPLTVNWTSRYGNKCTTVVKNSMLKIKDIELSDADFDAYMELGITLPTLRDMEVTMDPNLSSEDRWRVYQAQFIATDETDITKYLASKLAKLESMDPDIVFDIKTFVDRSQHGVEETVKVTDEHFEPLAAIKYFKESADSIEKMLRNLVDANVEEGNEIGMIAMAERVEELRAEATLLQSQLDAGERIAPKEEVITLNIDVMTFFPAI